MPEQWDGGRQEYHPGAVFVVDSQGWVDFPIHVAAYDTTVDVGGDRGCLTPVVVVPARGRTEPLWWSMV